MHKAPFRLIVRRGFFSSIKMLGLAWYRLASTHNGHRGPNMNIKGIVKGANHQRGWYMIQTAYGFTVAELIQGELNIHDHLYGDLDNHGEAYIQNVTSGEHVELYIEAIQATLQHAQSLL